MKASTERAALRIEAESLRRASDELRKERDEARERLRVIAQGLDAVLMRDDTCSLRVACALVSLRRTAWTG